MSEQTESRNNKPAISQKWNKPEAVGKMFGLSRTSIYQLIWAGKIRSASVPMTGGKRGTRLVDVASVQAYLDSLADAGSAK
jgi:hypothetical protein